ncbi:MAG: nucleotidyltransferase family protein [Chitinophagaceae bacterium]|nr:MAG: nucleotidyltransferase family protein [Chitinophagaceae bacterium]
MIAQPTLVILAEPELSSGDGAAPLSLFSVMDSTVRRGLASGLPMVVVAPPEMAQQARNLLPGNDVIELPQEPTRRSRADRLARAVAAGVEASSQAPGWLLLPADMPMLQVETLRAVANAVAQYTVVFPQYRHRRGHPVGFSAELFSELIRLDNERDLSRLTARYPAMGVDVDDPGVLMAQDAQSGLAQLRAQLHSTNLFPR